MLASMGTLDIVFEDVRESKLHPRSIIADLYEKIIRFQIYAQAQNHYTVAPLRIAFA